MASSYSLTFVNNSARFVSACVYQTAPDLANAQSLAWMVQSAQPAASAVFRWEIEHGFVCSEAVPLVPGAIVEAAEWRAADLKENNSITLTRQEDHHTFTGQKAGPHEGSLYIAEDSSVVAGQASVGIGMSGAGTFVVQAQPNTDLVFTPHPNYWITAGTAQKGEVLDIGSLTNPVQVEFPAGVYAMTAVLNADNTWSVMPS